MKTVNVNVSPEELLKAEIIERTRAEDQARLEEEIERESNLLRPDGDMDVTDPEQQAGRMLPRSLILARLRKLNPCLVYEQSKNYPEKGGIYYDGYLEDKVTGKLEYGHYFLCGIQHDYVREFDLRIAIPSVIPDPTIALHWQDISRVDSRERGWRSILLTLVKEGVIELDKAMTAFHLTEGRSSKNWQTAIN